MGKNKAKKFASAAIKSYMYDINYVVGLFSFSLFIGCLSLNDKDTYALSFTQQEFYALVSVGVVLLTIATRGRDIRENPESKKILDAHTFKDFIATSGVYLIGVVALFLLALY